MAKKRGTAKRTSVKKKVALPVKENKHLGLAIVALLLNVLLIPGLGTLIGGKIKTGIIQMSLMVLGVIFIFTIIGIVIGVPLVLGTWIWGIASGVQLIQKAAQ